MNTCVRRFGSVARKTFVSGTGGASATRRRFAIQIASAGTILLSSQTVSAKFLSSKPQPVRNPALVEKIDDNLTQDIIAVGHTTDIWLKTVTSGSRDAAAKTTALYATDAVLWGTLSEQIRDTPSEIKDYFEYFARKSNLEVSDYRPLIRVLGDIAINSGYYTFTWDEEKEGDSPSPRVSKKARYSFVYRRDPVNPLRWMIVDHHSSVMPHAPDALKPAN